MSSHESRSTRLGATKSSLRETVLADFIDFQRYLSRRDGLPSEIHTWQCTNGCSTKACQHQRSCSLGRVPAVRREQATRLEQALTALTGGLILLAMLYIRDRTNLPQPRCAIPHSPWTDVSSKLTGTKGHPLLKTDYVSTWSTPVPSLSTQAHMLTLYHR